MNPAVPDDQPLLIGDDDGLPAYFLDVKIIRSEAGILAVQLAAVAGNQAEVEQLLQDTLTRLGPTAFAHTAAAALSIISVGILGGALNLAASCGIDIRAGLQAILEAPS